VSKYSGNNECCEGCGLIYKDFRCSSITTFQEAKDAMFVISNNPKDWVYRRKRGVLRYWCGVKKKEWEQHKQECCVGSSECKLGIGGINEY